MDDPLTRGQETARQVLASIHTRRFPSVQKQPYSLDLQYLQSILERCVQHADHPANTLMVEIRSWGYHDGEELFHTCSE